MPRIALAHDWLVSCRGGESVLAAIAEVVAARAAVAGLYTMVSGGDDFARACIGRYAPITRLAPVRTSWLQHLPGAAGPLRRWMLPLFPSAIADLSRKLAAEHARDPIDLLISTSSAAIKGLHPPPGVPHLCYCHAPARYIWSQSDQYARGRAGRLRSLGLNAFGPRLRTWDRRTAAHVTRFLANSTHIAREIRRCYDRESHVVYPPVDTGFYIPDPSVPRGEHWLYAGALEPYKRVDELMSAAARNGSDLVIVGEGSQAAHLRSIAGPRVTFRGRISDEQLRHEYRSAGMVVFPQVEDFGIVAVEAQACGTPVLARRAGGALDTVIEGVTGAFFDEPAKGHTVDPWRDALARMPRCTQQTAAACRGNAERFSEARFRKALCEHIGELLHKTGIAPAATASAIDETSPASKG